jgi:hypothetical protein
VPNRSVRNLVLFFVWIGIVGVAVVAYLLLFSGGQPQTAEGPDQKAEETEPEEPEPKPEEPAPEPAPAPQPPGPTPSPQPPEPKPSPQPTPTPGPAPAPITQLMEVPFITWGGDMATFYANGGETTEPGSIFDKLGLKIKLTPGDDFLGQVDRYQRGEIDFLRGTFSMLGLASQKINADPDTEAVVFLQLTWSAGDHMVAREDCTTLDDLKGRKVAIRRAARGHAQRHLDDRRAELGRHRGGLGRRPEWAERSRREIPNRFDRGRLHGHFPGHGRADRRRRGRL